MSRRGMTPAPDAGNHKSQIPNPKARRWRETPNSKPKAPEQSEDDRMVGLVETMLVTADGLRLTACGPDEDEIRIVEDTDG